MQTYLNYWIRIDMCCCCIVVVDLERLLGWLDPDPTFHLYSPHTTRQNSMLYIVLGVDSPFSFSFTLRLT